MNERNPPTLSFLFTAVLSLKLKLGHTTWYHDRTLKSQFDEFPRSTHLHFCIYLPVLLFACWTTQLSIPGCFQPSIVFHGFITSKATFFIHHTRLCMPAERWCSVMMLSLLSPPTTAGCSALSQNISKLEGPISTLYQIPEDNQILNKQILSSILQLCPWQTTPSSWPAPRPWRKPVVVLSFKRKALFHGITWDWRPRTGCWKMSAVINHPNPCHHWPLEWSSSQAAR